MGETQGFFFLDELLAYTTIPGSDVNFAICTIKSKMHGASVDGAVMSLWI